MAAERKNGCGCGQTGGPPQYVHSAVLWRSGRQATAAASTSEAELTAGSLGTQIGIGLQCLLADWGQETYFHRSWDNRSTLSIAHLGGTWRSRHYAIRAQAVREPLALGQTSQEDVPTDEQIADVLTKALPLQTAVASVQQFFAPTSKSAAN